jgi:predicted negative regulator of RcsB-dependent stress response
MAAKQTEAQKPDEFLEALQRGFRYVIENIKFVSIIAGGILAGILIIFFVLYQMKATRLEEASLLNQAVAAYHEGNLEGSLSVLEKLAGKRGLSAVTAELYRGNIHYDQEKYDEALANFKRALELAGTTENNVLLALARQGVAYSEKSLGNLDRAAEAFSRLGGNFKDLSLLERARIYAEQGDKAKAREVLDELTNDFPQSPWVRSAEILKEQLNR